MAVDIAVIFLKILGGKEVRKQKGIPHARKETIEIKFTVTSSYFNGKAIRFSYQFSSTLKFMKSKKQK